MSMIKVARWYASHNIPVFPLKKGGKTPACRNGFKDATIVHRDIERLWIDPDYNIGIPTGVLFGVIDVDSTNWDIVEHDLIASYRNWLGVVRTPSGGCHIYVPPTGAGNCTDMLPGVDYRGVGGYVVAPPSWSEQYEAKWEWIDKINPMQFFGIESLGLD